VGQIEAGSDDGVLLGVLFAGLGIPGACNAVFECETAYSDPGEDRPIGGRGRAFPSFLPSFLVPSLLAAFAAHERILILSLSLSLSRRFGL